MIYDVAVIGAGLNGLMAALALGSSHLKRPLRVVLIDAKKPDAAPVTDTRGSALTLATTKLLSTLQLWDALQPHAEAMRKVIVTDGAKPIAERPVLLRFTTQEGEATTAHIVENGSLLSVLREGVAQSPAITQQLGVAVSHYSFGPGPARVELAAGTVIKASLIVGADGRNSPARAAAGIELRGQAYGQTALTFTIGHALPHGGQAEEHFIPTGVLAVLPLPGNRSSIVWTETDAEAQRLMDLSEPDFLAAFEARLGTHLGSLTLETARSKYPLALQLAREIIAPRLALVGDAAHVVHPLAGLGLNLGIKDVAALADVLADAMALGEDPGSLAVLERYARLRRFDTLMTSIGMDVMTRLFGNTNPFLTVLRDLGLQMVDRMPFAKHLLMQEAAGVTGSLPRLLRGLKP